ncbi:secondary thiamine-phosphate synthase enzyme YjbQ [Fluctibacter corallii]
MWQQTIIHIPPKARGFHLITSEVVSQLPQISYYDTGVLELFIQHTSASLTINENADPTVRADFERHFSHLVPEDMPYYTHTYEGSDDMPAHLKASLLGHSLTIPIGSGKLMLGTWQGIYLGEHRNHGGQRSIVATLNGNINQE